MKNTCKLVLLLVFLFSSQSIDADEMLFSAGYGLQTSGFGASAGYGNTHTLGYASIGCWRLREGDLVDNCGIGVGFQSGYIFNSSKHSVGLFVGNVGQETVMGEREVIYGGAANYSYYFNGIDKAGFYVGAGYAVGNGDSKDIRDLIINVGYRF